MLRVCCCGYYIKLAKHFQNPPSTRIQSTFCAPLHFHFTWFTSTCKVHVFVHSRYTLKPKDQFRTIVRGFIATEYWLKSSWFVFDWKLLTHDLDNHFCFLHPIHWWGCNLHNNGFVRKKCTSKCLLSDTYLPSLLTMAAPNTIEKHPMYTLAWPYLCFNNNTWYSVLTMLHKKRCCFIEYLITINQTKIS